MSLKDFNIENIVGNVLPNTFRTSTIIGFVRALITPIKTLHGQIFGSFYDNEIAKSYRHNQVALFEKELNEEFGLSYSISATNSIYITHERDTLDQVYFFEDSEIDTTYIYEESENTPLYLYTKEEYTTPFEFEVNIPDSLNLNENRLNTLINIIKMIDTTYLIKKY